MERTPHPPPPKPCFGLEHDLTNELCQECPVNEDCFQALGLRRGMVPLNKVPIQLVPVGYKVELEIIMGDPELPELERIYILCYKTIFRKLPKDRIGRNKEKLLQMIKDSECSVRLYMLTLMIAHVRQKEIVAGENPALANERPFTAFKLMAPNALSKLDLYREMCRKEFGTFDLTALDVLTGESHEESNVDKLLLNSEVMAGKFVVDIKIRSGGPQYVERLFKEKELHLDPHWLAIEPRYENLVFSKFLDRTLTGTATEMRHRHSVGMVVTALKKRKDYAIGLHQARERALAKAIPKVLSHFGYLPTDFEIDNQPVTDVLEFWCFVGRAISWHKCLRYVRGETPKLIL
jgi:hypothetical protein